MRLESFGINDSLTNMYFFPTAAVSDRLGDVEAAADFLTTPQGGFDTGDDEADDRPALLTKSFTIYAANPDAQQPLLDELRALRGKRGTLWARTYDGHLRRLENVRCKQIQYDRTNRNFQWQPITIFFEAPNQHWQGHDYTAWLLDDGYYLDSGLYFDDAEITFTLATSPQACIVTNGGNRAVTDVVLTITAAGTSINALTIVCGDAHLTWSGNLLVGNSLIIDCGAQNVNAAGTGAYTGFALGSNHAIEDWLVLEPGNNTITVTRTGGANSILQVEYRDGWY